MSGPKTSKYTLTPEQRRILAEQRKLAHRKSIASETIQRNRKRLLQIGSIFSAAKTVSDALVSRTGSDNGFAERMPELEGILASVASVVAGVNAEDVVSLENASKTISESLAKAEKIASELSQISARNEVELQAVLHADIDKGFDTSFADIAPAAAPTVTERRKTLLAQLIRMKNNKTLPAEWITELEKAIGKINDIRDETFLKNFSSVTVAPLLKRCQIFLDECEACHEEFEKLYAEYIALCNLYCYVAQEYPCCAASIEALKAEIRRISAVAAENDEQAYISECLDEVMEEMGYTVIGSREVTKKNGKHFRNELYTYGDGTAVNVTYSSDGRIAMELGGIDSVDRLPEARETAALCASMEQFCDDFKEIEKRLLAKGVVLAHRVSLLPPSAEYAQIINTTEYRMTEETDTSQAKKKRRTAKNRKAMGIE